MNLALQIEAKKKEAKKIKRDLEILEQGYYNQINAGVESVDLVLNFIDGGDDYVHWPNTEYYDCGDVKNDAPGELNKEGQKAYKRLRKCLEARGVVRPEIDPDMLNMAAQSWREGDECSFEYVLGTLTEMGLEITREKLELKMDPQLEQSVETLQAEIEELEAKLEAVNTEHHNPNPEDVKEQN